VTTTARPRLAASARLAPVALLGVTAVWGSTFFLLKDVVERIPASDLLAVRFALAAAALWLLAPRSVAALTRAERRSGLLLGLVYGGGQLLQTVGIQYTSASVSGFVTGMYVVFTPLLGAALLRARIGTAVWFAVALATAGLATLSLQGLAVGGDEALTLASALLYAAHIVGLGAWSSGRNAVGLTVVQLLTITVVCGLFAAPGGVALPQSGGDWFAVAYMALAAGALALVLQTWAQAHMQATRAAIIMTSEPVWAGLFAVLLGGERLGPRVLVGGGLVLAAMYLVELGPRGPDEPDAAKEIGGVPHTGPG
jgi:drug/metabolite transporter (DMT)-like permease